MKIRFNVKFQLNARGNILHENIKVMNTGYLTVILSVECFIHGNLSVFCQKNKQTMSIFVLLINNNDSRIQYLSN
jgi:hypothetical protein